MDNVTSFIFLVENHRYIGYLVLFVALIFEGELFMLAAGVLSRLRAFDFVDVFWVSMLGVLAGDVLWYWTGRFLKEKYPRQRLIKFAERRVKRMFPSIECNPFRLIFISKFLYGFNHSTILVLGFLKINFWDFLRVQLRASFLWVIIFLTLGYFFGQAALSIAHKFNKFTLSLLVIFLAFLVVERIFDKAIGKKIAQKKNCGK